MNYDELFEELARAGYETYWDDLWCDLQADSLERDLWRVIAKAIVSRLWEIFKGESPSGVEEK